MWIHQHAVEKTIRCILKMNEYSHRGFVVTREIEASHCLLELDRIKVAMSSMKVGIGESNILLSKSCTLSQEPSDKSSLWIGIRNLQDSTDLVNAVSNKQY